MGRLADHLEQYGQAHVLKGVEALSDAAREAFERQLEALDLAELDRLFRAAGDPPARPGDLAPVPVEERSAFTASHRERGMAALASGKVALLVVAGGQGSRLGSDLPKGLFPVGPVSDATLFRWHAEKVAALSERVGRPVPLLVMTSPATHAATAAYFADTDFGLAPGQVRLFQQGTMPALELATGKLLLEAPGRLALSPNGHGGTLTALADSGLLAELESVGVETIFYFQVDNPLVRLADPAFLGRHIELGSEVSTKVVFKVDPEEKVGVLALVGGRCGVVEYSDLPAELAAARGPGGDLLYPAGNTAIHLFDLQFLKRVTAGAERLRYHAAKKRLAHYDPESGETAMPTGPNAVKFELFIFDALPAARRFLVAKIDRADEFAPLKNATGADGPDRVRGAISGQARRWLRGGGATVPDAVPLELSPRVMLWPDDAHPDWLKTLKITGPRRVELPDSGR